MKTLSICLVLLFCFFGSSLQAKYAPPAFFDMVGASDFIFLGEIQEVRESTFILKINETLVGTYEGQEIEIQQFKDWTCSARWAPYQVGQKVIAFVNKHRTLPNSYALRSAGSEGEFPVDGESVYYRSYPQIENAIFEKLENGGGQKVLLADMLSAIKEYSSCFRISSKDLYERITEIEKIGSEKHLENYAKKSLVHQLLISNTLAWENEKNKFTHVRSSGLKYKVLREGNGKKPEPNQFVEVHYEGRFSDGKVFDSSYQRNKTITFPVRGVIKGWVEALQLMQEGAHWQLTIPSHLAYGEKGIPGVIPPNATLIFDVELIQVKDQK